MAAELLGVAVSAAAMVLGILGLVRPAWLPLWGTGPVAMSKGVIFTAIGGACLIASLVKLG